jgi:formamidopyrimidine-DNA glycosylase
MGIRQLDHNELREQLKAEQARFKELDEKKKTLLSDAIVQGGGNIQEYEAVKAQWQDSAEEIKHLHRKLYPNFPRHSCPNCGCDCTPILGSGRSHYGCIACGDESIT